MKEKKIIVKNPKERARKIKTEIAMLLQSNKISPAQAASLRGRLGFSQTLMFGRIGSSRNCHLIQRQYSKSKNVRITPLIKEELVWWFKNIDTLPHRHINLTHESNNVIYSDASGEGGVCLGTIIGKSHHQGPFPAFSGEAPNWLKNENIFTLEILASVIAIAQLGSLQGSGLTLAFIDNTAAASALIRGSTDKIIPRLIVSAFWTLCKKYKITPWIEIVSSGNNPADAPSRGVKSKMDLAFGSLKRPDFIENEERLRAFIG